jgi:hypothetical protein
LFNFSDGMSLFHRSQWARRLRRRSWPLFAGIVGFSYGCLCFCVVLSCVGRDFATGWFFVQRSPAECLKFAKPLVWGSQGPYKDCRATDDDVILVLLLRSIQAPPNFHFEHWCWFEIEEEKKFRCGMPTYTGPFWALETANKPLNILSRCLRRRFWGANLVLKRKQQKLEKLHNK